MANKRIYGIHQLTYAEGTAIGGLKTFNITPEYANVIQSTPDGATFAEDLDIASLGFNLDFSSTDVDRVGALLASSGQAIGFRAKESGLSTVHTYALAGVLFSGMSMNLPRYADAEMRITGQAPLADGTDAGTALKLPLVPVGTVAGGGANEYPNRLFRPNTANFIPTEGGGSFWPLHVESLTLNAVAELIRDNADSDKAFSAVDSIGWGPLQVGLRFRDATVTNGLEVAAEILTASVGKLTVQLTGRGGGADNAVLLTINNLKFSRYSVAMSQDYAVYDMQGWCGWRDGAQALVWDGSEVTGILNFT